MALQEIKVPDIGDFKEVDVIEVLVQAGDTVNPEDSLLTLESDKASMEIPSPAAGTVKEVKVKVGDKVTEGSLILLLDSATETPAEKPVEPTRPTGSTEATSASKQAATTGSITAAAQATSKAQTDKAPLRRDPPAMPAAPVAETFHKIHASPSIRRFARELGVDLSQLQGSGRKGRITKDDVQNYVKAALSGQTTQSAATSMPTPAGGAGIPAIPAIDFSQFGAIEAKPLSRIQKLSGPHLHRAWLNVPMVTQQHEADVTELEDFRASLKAEAEKQGVRVTTLAFIMRAVAAGLQEFPKFNSSLSPDGQQLIYKKYINLGIAVDTPNGLVVPVFRDVGQKSIFELSAELAAMSRKARDGKLSPKDLQGGCFSISSLGGIGGGHFTPIVNAPEVAILGVSRAQMKPVWDGKNFIPRLMLPLSLSYDHRVIDGADGARFIVYLAGLLENLRRLLL
ncbi:MAG: dihydrolipoyllysine-residue acetyltransferase [Gammaproteobacteria bacterium]